MLPLLTDAQDVAHLRELIPDTGAPGMTVAMECRQVGGWAGAMMRAAIAALVLPVWAGAAMAQGMAGTALAPGAVPACIGCETGAEDTSTARGPFRPEDALPPLPVAIFGEDRRQPVWDLLRRAPGTLSVEERAIVQAAGRIGTMACGNNGTNGTLIRLVDGRDAVMTSAHSFIEENGPLCDLSTARFMPNVGYHLGGDFTDFTLRLVPTTGEVLNADNRDLLPTIMAMNGDIALEADFLIFPLAAPISTDVLPDGSIRGFMRIGIDIPPTGTAFMIGFNYSFEQGLTPGYEPCAYERFASGFYHLCASTDSSSSSPLMILEEGELILAAMNSRVYTRYIGLIVPIPDDLRDGNIAVSMDTIRAYLESIGRPAVTAPVTGAVLPAPKEEPLPAEVEL